MYASARSSNNSRAAIASFGPRSRARVAWRCAWVIAPTSRARCAAASSRRIACSLIVAGTPGTGPISATSSAAVAAWCATWSIGALDMCAITDAVPA